MRDLIIWCSDAPGLGGAELALVRATEMVQARSQIILYSRDAAPKLVKHFASTPHCAYPAFWGRNSVRHALRSLTVAYKLSRKYKSATFVIWCHHIDSNRWLQFGFALFRRDFIIVERVVPSDWSIFRNSRLSRPLKMFATRHARAVVLNAFSAVENYTTFFRIPTSKVHVVPNSRPFGSISSRISGLKQERDALRRTYKIDPSATVVICVGRLHVQKDQRTLLEAFRRLRLQANNLALVLVGEGEDQEALERETLRQSIPDVFFVGYHHDVLPFLAMADLFVLPSLFEGLSGALLEAIAAGIPCIVSEIPGNLELIRGGVSGLTFIPQSADSLEERLTFAVNNIDVLTQFASVAQEFAIARYDEDKETRIWRSLLQKIDF